MAIVYDENSVDLILKQDPELTKIIMSDLEYLVQQHRHSNQREFLIKSTCANLIKKYHEYPMMIDGKMNTNDQPF